MSATGCELYNLLCSELSWYELGHRGLCEPGFAYIATGVCCFMLGFEDLSKVARSPEIHGIFDLWKLLHGLFVLIWVQNQPKDWVKELCRVPLGRRELRPMWCDAGELRHLGSMPRAISHHGARGGGATGSLPRELGPCAHEPLVQDGRLYGSLHHQ